MNYELTYKCYCSIGSSLVLIGLGIEIDAATCENGGTLVILLNSSSCICAHGFTGDRCETNIDDCERIICENGGNCVDGIKSYTCECPDGFIGAIRYKGSTCETGNDGT